MASLHAKNSYVARLSKDGLRVLCGYPLCRYAFGTVRQHRKHAWYRDFILPPGWKQERDGVWRLTRYAEERFTHGDRPKHRGPLVMKATEDQPQGVAFQRGDYPHDQDRIECPRCQERHASLIDFATLRLTTDEEKLAARGN